MALDAAMELRPYTDRSLPIVFLHKFDRETCCCTCRNDECQFPGKHPATNNGVHDAKQYKLDQLLACVDYRNFAFACGGSYVVLDIDPRNGGNEKLSELEDKYGKLPQTWTVITGSGGRHLYFSISSEVGIGNRHKKEGVELKGRGSYVVTAGSITDKGEYYWDIHPEDIECAELPQWLIDECITSYYSDEKVYGGSELDGYEREEIIESLSSISSDCSREQWISIGMALKVGGFDKSIWDDWSKQSQKYPGEKEIDRQWKSFKRNGLGPATIIHLAQQNGWKRKPVDRSFFIVPEKKEPEQTPFAPTLHRETIVSKNLAGDYPPGRMGQLARLIEVSALHSHKVFAIASSIVTVAALSQGAFVSPLRKGYLGQYVMLIAPASAGKEHYSSRPSHIIGKVAPWLRMGIPQSPQALRTDLFECNSRLITMDEGLRWIQTQSESKNATDRNLVSDLMSIWGMGEPVLPALRTKAKENSSPEIHNPHVSIIGCGTTEKIEHLLRKSASFVEDGTLSRFDFVFSDYNHPESFVNKVEFGLDPDLSHALLAIAESNLGEQTFAVNAAAESKIDRRVYCDPKSVGWSEEAKALWDQTAIAWNRQASTQEKIASSVWNRGAEKALRTASLLAVLEDPVSPTISLEQMEWAVQWQSSLCETTSSIVVEKVAQTDQEIAERAILAALGRGIYSLGRIANTYKQIKKLDHRTVLTAIDALIARGEVEQERARGNGRGVAQIKLKLISPPRE